MSLIKKRNELPIKKTVVGGIYGQPGAGKTTLALSMPKPLLLDIEKGLSRVQYEYRTDSVQVYSYDDILNILQEDLTEYETIVIDTLGKLVDIMCEKAAKENSRLLQSDGTFSQKGWGVVKNYFKGFIKELEKLNKNLIFVAHEREEKDGDNKIVRPDVSGSSGKDIIKEFDFMGYVEIIGKKRSICFAPSDKFYAKNSLHLNDNMFLPILEQNSKNTFLTDYILNPTIERRKQECKIDEEYKKVIAQAEKIIKEKGITEESKKELRELKKIGDSQMQIKAMIDEKQHV